MRLWITIFISGLLTFGTRLSFISLFHKLRMPEWFRRALRFVPAAVLSAITLPALVSPDGGLFISWKNPELLSGALAILVAWRTKNVLLTIVCGMATLLLLEAILPA